MRLLAECGQLDPRAKQLILLAAGLLMVSGRRGLHPRSESLSIEKEGQRRSRSLHLNPAAQQGRNVPIMFTVVDSLKYTPLVVDAVACCVSD